MYNSGAIEGLNGRINSLEKSIDEIKQLLMSKIEEQPEVEKKDDEYAFYVADDSHSDFFGYDKYYVKSGYKMWYVNVNQNFAGHDISVWTASIDDDLIQIPRNKAFAFDEAIEKIKKIDSGNFTAEDAYNELKEAHHHKYTDKEMLKLAIDDWDKFYKIVKEYQKAVDDGDKDIGYDMQRHVAFDLSIIKDNKKFIGRIIDAIAWFDVDKLARMIVRNNTAVNKENSDDNISTYKIDGYDFDEVKNGLIDNIREAVQDLIKSGDATVNETYKEFQVGRIHIIAVYVNHQVEHIHDCYKYNKVKLFWTNDETEADEEIDD